MKNKIIGTIGMLIILFSVVGYFAFDNTIRKSSEVFGKEVVVFSKPILAGQVIAREDLSTKKIKKEQLVPYVVTDINLVIGKVALINMYPNEQVVSDRLVTQDKYYSNETKIVSFPTTLIDTVAGQVKKGDYVDIWLKAIPEYPAQNYKEPQKIFSNVRIEGLKNEEGIDLEKAQSGVPTICLVRLTDEQIKVLKTFVPGNNVTNFMTLYSNQMEKAMEVGK